MSDTPSVVLHDPTNVSQKLVPSKSEKKHDRRNSSSHGKNRKNSKGGEGGGGSGKEHKAGSGSSGGHQTKKSGSLKVKKKTTTGYVLKEWSKHFIVQFAFKKYPYFYFLIGRNIGGKVLVQLL